MTTTITAKATARITIELLHTFFFNKIPFENFLRSCVCTHRSKRKLWNTSLLHLHASYRTYTIVDRGGENNIHGLNFVIQFHGRLKSVFFGSKRNKEGNKINKIEHVIYDLDFVKEICIYFSFSVFNANKNYYYSVEPNVTRKSHSFPMTSNELIPLSL